MAKDSILYFIIMTLLYLGNIFLVFNFLARTNTLLVLAISLLIAMSSHRFANWLIKLIFIDSY